MQNEKKSFSLRFDIMKSTNIINPIAGINAIAKKGLKMQDVTSIKVNKV